MVYCHSLFGTTLLPVPAILTLEGVPMPPIAHSSNSALKCSLRVLLVEDNPDDAALSQRLLRKTYPDLRCEIVQTPQEFSRRIRSTYYDVVLADYALGPWTGIEAFNLMRKAGRDTPFILVTGALDDARAVPNVCHSPSRGLWRKRYFLKNTIGPNGPSRMVTRNSTRWRIRSRRLPSSSRALASRMSIPRPSG